MRTTVLEEFAKKTLALTGPVDEFVLKIDKLMSRAWQKNDTLVFLSIKDFLKSSTSNFSEANENTRILLT